MDDTVYIAEESTKNLFIVTLLQLVLLFKEI